jgi:hypothetical protein
MQLLAAKKSIFIQGFVSIGGDFRFLRSIQFGENSLGDAGCRRKRWLWWAGRGVGWDRLELSYADGPRAGWASCAGGAGQRFGFLHGSLQKTERPARGKGEKNKRKKEERKEKKRRKKENLESFPKPNILRREKWKITLLQLV